MVPPRSEFEGDEIVVYATEQEPDSVVHAIVTAVAEREGVSPVSLPPLSDHVDPDALEALLHHARERGCLTSVTFDYEGYRVVATSGPDYR